MNNRPAPKFAIGETVIIQTLQHPEFNGMEAKVLDRRWYETGEVSAVDNPEGRFYAAWWYLLDVDPIQFHERTLRPKPKRDDDAEYERFKKKLNLTKPKEVEPA